MQTALLTANEDDTNDFSLFFQKFLRSRKYLHKPVNNEIDRKISAIFVSIGIPPHIKGYSYLRYAIKSCVNEPEIISAITKRLYPSVAEYFKTSASKVERAIRHSIEVCWNRGRIEALNNLFNSKIFNAKNRPTNGEFIALISDKLLLERG